MLRIQAETVGTGASGVKKQSHRQLLDAKKGTDTKPVSSDPVIGWVSKLYGGPGKPKGN